MGLFQRHPWNWYNYTHTHTHTHTYIHTHIYIHTYIHTRTYTRVHTHTYTHVHTRTYIHTHTRTRRYIHTHTVYRYTCGVDLATRAHIFVAYTHAYLEFGMLIGLVHVHVSVYIVFTLMLTSSALRVDWLSACTCKWCYIDA